VTQVARPRRETAFHWMQTDDVIAMAYDVPVLGFGTDAVSSIRLWSAAATEDFNLAYFNSGNYIEAVKEKSETETISRVLIERHSVWGANSAGAIFLVSA
jgi:starch phosphorylase